jgi:uncharacterized membrane protein
MMGTTRPDPAPRWHEHEGEKVVADLTAIGDGAVAAMSRYRGSVPTTSLSKADEQDLQEARLGQQAAAH